MARNYEKYVYITIGILRNGLTHQALQADAEEHHTKHLPTIAGIRLSEYYRMKAEDQYSGSSERQGQKYEPDGDLPDSPSDTANAADE